MSDARTLVYVAGPVRSMGAMVHAGLSLLEAGHAPVFMSVAPSLDSLDRPRLAACHAVLRLPGESMMADVTVERAKQCGMPVYFELAACLADLSGVPALQG